MDQLEDEIKELIVNELSNEIELDNEILNLNIDNITDNDIIDKEIQELSNIEEEDHTNEADTIEENTIEENTIEENTIEENTIEENTIEESDNTKEEIDSPEDNINIDELADDFVKIKDRQKQKQMQLELLIDIIKAIGYKVSNIKDISFLRFERDFLKERSTQDKIISFIPELRKCYNSAYLTCLHSNAKEKQKNLGINVIRQIMKCNYLKMTPKKVSHGYDKSTGKKLESRFYLIEKMLY